MEEIFDIRSCIEILANSIKIYTICQYRPTIIIKTYKKGGIFILHLFRGKSGLVNV